MLAALPFSFLLSATAWSAEEVNIYSERQAVLLKPILERFTERTGIKTNILFAKQGLIERIQAEGDDSPADVVLAADIGRLQAFVDADIAAEVSDAELESAIPPDFRDPDGRWFGLTRRARIFFVARDRVDPSLLKEYGDLADARWKGRVCTRSGRHPYNIALFAAMVVHRGEEGATDWLRGLKDSLARTPKGNDRAQIKGLEEGACDIAVANSYYYLKMLGDPDQADTARAAIPVFPVFRGGGTHTNLSGGLITRHAPNRDNALTLLRFLASPEAQSLYASANHEFPVRDDVPVPDDVAEHLSTLVSDNVALSDISANRRLASQLAEKVGYDF